MSPAAAFSRPPDTSLANTLQQITLRSPKDAEAIHVWAKMILARLLADEQQEIRLHAKW